MTEYNDNNLDDDFSSFRDDLFGDDEPASFADDLPPMEDMDDEFEELRRKSTRGESLDDDLASDDALFSEERSSGSGFAWRNFTPGQRLILALLVLLNILMGAIGLMVITGNLG
ncbi:MAG: hypothetical protein H6652_15185 [Ardenticatenaceae bacterium]|nr:hypothetical protein [Ardenticatenaceae bacterium]MCB8946908.1 hypothetical protein [Ardenticatenaceae bacterium]